MPKKRNIVLMPVDIHWGEIDWILPVIHMLRTLRPDLKIVAAFKTRELYDKHDSHQSLYRELQSISDHIAFPNPSGSVGSAWYHLSTGLAARGAMHYVDKVMQAVSGKPQGSFPTAFLVPTGYIFSHDFDPDDVCLILKDYANDTRFDRVLERKCQNAKIAVYPHATSIFISQECNRKPNPEYYRHQHSHDLFLVSSQMSAEWWRDQHCQEDCTPIGFPRLDRWWMEYLLKDDNFKQSDDYKFASNAKRVFTYITRHPATNMLALDDMKYLIPTAAETVLSYDDAVLIYKPHPSQSIEQLQELLAPYDSSRIRISSYSALQLLSISDFVLSMHSSCIMDALALNKPVVEYFRYKENPAAYTVRNDGYVICPNGKLGSPHRYLNLVAPADTAEELSVLIDDYFAADTHAEDSIWKDQQRRFRAICPDTYDDATRRTCNAILELIN